MNRKGFTLIELDEPMVNSRVIGGEFGIGDTTTILENCACAARWDEKKKEFEWFPKFVGDNQ